jgi:hypothetical protein
MGTRDQPLSPQKDGRLKSMLSKIERRLGPDAFQVVDHWQADLWAVGIAHPNDEHLLAYIAADLPDDRYFVELETLPAPGSELPYAVAGRFQSVSFDELVEPVAAHLRSASA